MPACFCNTNARRKRPYYLKCKACREECDEAKWARLRGSEMMQEGLAPDKQRCSRIGCFRVRNKSRFLVPGAEVQTYYRQCQECRDTLRERERKSKKNPYKYGRKDDLEQGQQRCSGCGIARPIIHFQAFYDYRQRNKTCAACRYTGQYQRINLNPGQRCCPRCKQVKAETDFGDFRSKDPDQPTLLTLRCADCRNEIRMRIAGRTRRKADEVSGALENSDKHMRYCTSCKKLSEPGEFKRGRANTWQTPLKTCRKCREVISVRPIVLGLGRIIDKYSSAARSEKGLDSTKRREL